MSTTTGGLALLIEDDTPIRTTMGIALSMAGLRAHAVANGEDALEYLNEAAEVPAVIFLDLRMPQLDGEGFRRWQLGNDRVRSVPTVLLSADSGLEERAAELGVTHYLKKPFLLEELLDLARKYCC